MPKHRLLMCQDSGERFRALGPSYYSVIDSHYIICLAFTTLNVPRREKTCLQGFANNKDADQPGHRRSLISACVIRLLESIIYELATSEI